MTRALLSVLVICMATTLAFAQQLHLSWTDNTNGQAQTIVQRGPATSGPFATIAQLPLGATSYEDTTVSYGTTYCYRVAATNASGTSAYSNVACGATAMAIYLLSVTTQGPGTVTSSPGGITCGATCSAIYGAGTQVRLTATPNNGARFYGWSGAAGCGTALTCTLTINGPTSVLATFTRKK
jgi:hypothetical protein